MFAQSTLKEALSKENKSLRLFPKLIQELAKNDFPLSYDFNTGAFTIHDFYKSGDLTLVLDDNDLLVAFDKEGNKGEIKDIEQIVRLNFYWWQSSQTKAGYPQLTKFWTEQFLKRKWLRIVRVYVPDLDAYTNSSSEKDIHLHTNDLAFEKNQIDKTESNQNQDVEINSNLSTIESIEDLEKDLSLEELEKLTSPQNEFKKENAELNFDEE